MIICSQFLPPSNCSWSLDLHFNLLSPSKAGFLVSFLVDARGGAMTGHRHWGMRVVIPPGAVQQPTRVNCRYQPLTKMAFPPPFMEREALASRVVEISPAGERFRAPVLIEIPHFASTANAERETVRDICAVQTTSCSGHSPE